MDNPLAKYSSNFVAFCRDMVVPIGGKFYRFGDKWDDCQRGIVEKLAPSVHCVKRGDVPPQKRFAICATKGYGKDLIATLALMFVLMFAERPTRAQLLANKQQQANEPLDIMRNILWADGPLNRLAAQVIELQNYRVVSHRNTDRPESVVEVLATDRQGHGSRPDILVANELTHLEDEMHFRTADDNLAKCPHGLGLYLYNAGFVGTWQQTAHEQWLSDPLYDVTAITHPAPWIDGQVLASKARTDPPSRHQQYYYGVWASPEGDVLPRELITRATLLLEPHYQVTHPYRYIAAADLSSTVNRSGFTAFGVAYDRPIVLAEAISWKPKDFVDSTEFRRRLRKDIREVVERLGVELIAFDQHQSALLIDLCNDIGVNQYQYRAAGHDFDDIKNNASVRAEYLFRAFHEGWVHIFDHPQLILDLKGTSIVTNTAGSKLVFNSDDDGGHGDLSDSFATGLVIALTWQAEMRQNVELYGTPHLPESRDEVIRI